MISIHVIKGKEEASYFFTAVLLNGRLKEPTLYQTTYFIRILNTETIMNLLNSYTGRQKSFYIGNQLKHSACNQKEAKKCTASSCRR
jgi:hypothetical protein